MAGVVVKASDHNAKGFKLESIVYSSMTLILSIKLKKKIPRAYHCVDLLNLCGGSEEAGGFQPCFFGNQKPLCLKFQQRTVEFVFIDSASC